MLTVILILNLFLTGLCWYGVWQVWRLQRVLSRVTEALLLAEQSAQALRNAPAAIQQAQTSMQQVQQQYQQALFWLRQIQQVLALLSLGQWLGRQWLGKQRLGKQRPSFSRRPFSRPRPLSKPGLQ